MRQRALKTIRASQSDHSTHSAAQVKIMSSDVAVVEYQQGDLRAPSLALGGVNLPNILSNGMARDCIVVSSSANNLKQKQAEIDVTEVEALMLSFKNVYEIRNLGNFTGLTKLMLDNNVIQRIEGLDALINLEWLDLSFNSIRKLEGLESLGKLCDLTVFNNQIEVIEGLDQLSKLQCLSIGNNRISKLQNVAYLHKFRDLHLLNLAGNPICEEQHYVYYVLAHTRELKYLDYRLVDRKDLIVAREQYQDDILDMEEEDRTGEQAATLIAEHEMQSAKYASANLDGLDALFSTMLDKDPEWTKLSAVPGLLDATAAYRERFQAASTLLEEAILASAEVKQAEVNEFEAAIRSATAKNVAQCRQIVVSFDKQKKRIVRELEVHPFKCQELCQKLEEATGAMEDSLMTLECQMVDIEQSFVNEFERNYSKRIDEGKEHYTSFFSGVRDLEQAWFEQVQVDAALLVEKYVAGAQENVSEAARALLQDKDTVMSAVQGSHDAHGNFIDSTEDFLVNKELNRFNLYVRDVTRMQHKRNRERVVEVSQLIEQTDREIADMLGAGVTFR